MVSQPGQNPKLFSTGPNPAQSAFEVWLDTLLNSKLSKILGHESTLKYLSSQGPKVELEDRPSLLLSSQRTSGIALLGFMVQPAATSILEMQLAQLVEFKSNLAVLIFIVILTPHS